MAIYVVSDLHLDERAEARMFSDERQGRHLSSLCERVAREDGSELIVLGDAFDFTAMQPPPKGLRRFFRDLDVPREEPRRRTLPELLAAVRESNPVAFESLGRLAESAAVTFVPGNHDYQLGEPGAGDALASAGIRARLERSAVRKLAARTIVLQHGHELDEGNDKPGGSGEMLTAALHHAVIPFLRHHGPPPHVRFDPDRLVALRPEEAVISVLQRWLDEKTFRRFFRAFLRLLADNGFLPRPLSWLATMVSADRVRSAVAKQDRLWERTGSHAIDVLKGKGHLPHGAPTPDVAVLGHTHVLDWAIERGRLYVNLGTWTERAFDASSPRDESLPLLHVEASNGRLRVSLRDLAAAEEELQRYEP